MRKVIVVSMASLDGYYSGLDGDMATLGVDDGFNRFNSEIVSSAGAVLIGHESFKSFSQYWPDRENAKDASENERQFAVRYNPLKKYVVSQNANSVTVPVVWQDSVEIISSDMIDTISNLKQHDGGDILIWGSRNVWLQLVEAGLVDELHVVTGIGVASSGIPLFDERLQLRLKPKSTRLINDSHCVATQYELTY